MIKIINILFIIFLYLFMLSVHSDELHPYLSIDEVPNAINIVPPPPALDSIDFQNDINKYKEGKALRYTLRGKLAAQDCYLLNGALQQAFSEAFGVEISKKNTPKLYDILSSLIIDAGKFGTLKIKKYYHRTRPYIYFNENTCDKTDSKLLANNGSYISGHTTLGWATALILAEVNPKRQNQILRRGYEFGQSRVICGYHWQSDVTNASIVAAGLVAKLHTNSRFIQDLNKAKEEFENIKYLLKK